MPEKVFRTFLCVCVGEEEASERKWEGRKLHINRKSVEKGMKREIVSYSLFLNIKKAYLKG